MKANVFVERFGVDDAREYLCGASFWEIDGKPLAPCVNDLKRIVESYELVESYGGINGARKELANLCDNLIDCAYLCQAIADVESCQ